MILFLINYRNTGINNKAEIVLNESILQRRQKNNQTFIQPEKEQHIVEVQIIEEPQLSHRSVRGQTTDSVNNLKQKLKINPDNQQKVVSGQNQNMNDEVLNNTNTNPVPSRSTTSHQNTVTQNFIQMLQINAQRKNKGQNSQNSQFTQQTLNSQGKTTASANSISTSTLATSQTATQFYTLDQQPNNIVNQIFTQSAGFSSPNNKAQRKSNLQISSPNSNKNINSKKISEQGCFNGTNLNKQNQQYKSNSLQRQTGNSKQQQNQTAQFTGQNILDRISNEYYSKLIQNFKPKYISETENTPKVESSQQNFSEILFSTQADGKSQQEKIELEKAVEEEYMNNIIEINKDIIQKKKQFIESTNQSLSFCNSNNKNNNSYGLKSSSNILRNSHQKKTSQQIGSKQDQRNRSQQQQSSSVKKLQSLYDSKQSYQGRKNTNCYDSQMTSTGTSFYKSNSLSKKDCDKQTQLNLNQIPKKNLPKKPVSASNKVPSLLQSKPKSPQNVLIFKQDQNILTHPIFFIKKQISGIQTIFSNNFKGYQAIDIIQNSQNKGIQVENKEKCKQLFASNQKTQAVLNTMSQTQQTKKLCNENQNTIVQSEQENPYQTGISMYISQVKQSQMQQYLACPRNEHDNIDNIEVDLKISRKSSRDIINSENIQSQSDKSPQLLLPNSQANQNDIQNRINRILTPVNIGFCYYNTSMDMHSRYPNQDDYFCNIFRQHFIQTYNALNFCKSLEPVDQLILQSKLIELPLQPTKKKTIVFDLDETLIHCNEDPNIYSDVIIPIKFPNGEIVQTGINIRPYAKECLKELSKHFEIIVFTASHSCYAERVIEYIDPNRDYIDLILSRDNCVQTQEGVHIKDLRIFYNRDLKDIVIVDNAAYSFGYQIENGIPIIPFFDNKKDMELKYLIDFLKKLLEINDVREFLHKTFKMTLYSECESVEEALERVYGIKQQESRADLNEDLEQQDEFEVYVQDFQNQNQYQINNFNEGQYNDEDEDDDFEREEEDDLEDENQQNINQV